MTLAHTSSVFLCSFVFSGGVMIYIDRIEVVNMLAPYAGMLPICCICTIINREFVTEEGAGRYFFFFLSFTPQ